jgi:hypothetical protein
MAGTSPDINARKTLCSLFTGFPLIKQSSAYTFLRERPW